jgi:DNA-binding CsgD family transcriptional regulator
MTFASSHAETSLQAIQPFLDSRRLPPPPRSRDLPAIAETGGRDTPNHPALGALDRLGCGYLVLADGRSVVEANATARTLLLGASGATRCLEEVSRAFRRLMDRSRTRPTLGALSWVVVSGRDEAPLFVNQTPEQPADGRCLVMLLDLDAHLQPNPSMLQRMFGLTLAETRLAMLLAQGEVPMEIARSRRLSRTTVRSQLAAIFAKTQTRRQAELVSLLTRVAVLP